MTNLIEKIKKYTPPCMNYKDGISSYWGYHYPPKHELKIKGEKYTRFCIDSLDLMEGELRKMFRDAPIILDERDCGDIKVNVEQINIENKLAKFVSRLFNIPLSVVENMPGNFSNDSPLQQRLLVWDYGHGREVALGVSLKRKCSGFSNGYNMAIANHDDSLIIGYSDLPILISLKNFKSRDPNYQEINKNLAKSVFGPIWKAFPYVHDVSPSSLFKPFVRSEKPLFEDYDLEKNELK